MGTVLDDGACNMSRERAPGSRAQLERDLSNNSGVVFWIIKFGSKIDLFVSVGE